MSRKTIGENPLDALLTPIADVKVATTPRSRKSTVPLSKESKQRLTVEISADVVERAKNATYWTRGLTLARLTQDALERAITLLEKNSAIFDDKTGKPLKEKSAAFPQRPEELKSGRPVK